MTRFLIIIAILILLGNLIFLMQKNDELRQTIVRMEQRVAVQEAVNMAQRTYIIILTDAMLARTKDIRIAKRLLMIKGIK